MFRSGLEGIYVREDYNKFSTVKHEGYHTFLENANIRHSGYEISRNDGLVEVPKYQLETIEDLKYRLLANPSEHPLEKHFIQKCTDRVAYTSYSRSGNTLLRIYFEKLTDVFTGSDGDLNYALHQSLQHCGFTAEAHLDNVWIVKTHYPLGKDKTVTARKVICCVRNPLDVVTSMFNFWSTQTQNLSCDAEF